MTDYCFDEHSLFDRGGYKHVSVGKRLRNLRLASGYSIKTLAEISGLAVNTLSLIENEKTSPSVKTLEQLAQALEVPLTCFFEVDNKKPRVIRTQFDGRQKYKMGGIYLEDCGLALNSHSLQPLIVTLPAHMKNVSESILHGGYEFVYCLVGRLEYYVDEEKYSLVEGDTLALDASLPHRWINPYDEPAVYLLVMVPDAGGDFSGKVHFQKDIAVENELI